ncbi:hypothetical protein BOX15_Mlig018545g2 [Macrostomum lignano]|uniref:Uncharacterized protein n=1 Tax=Macrostomum lignano TaxID=282301 RepID=A0A267H8R4_9PLAT|nr:hypothetical protein BOX15_Mlig018545g2 [Macrostomum lignano]
MGFTKVGEIRPGDCYTNGRVTNWACSYFDEAAVITLLVILVIAVASVAVCCAYNIYHSVLEKRNADDGADIVIPEKV